MGSESAVADLESNTGVEVRRIHVDKGYLGHDYPNHFRVFISGNVLRTAAAIKREMKRRSTVEPVIGHLKAGHRMYATASRASTAIASTPSSPAPVSTSISS
jgi:hypothetical protein